MKNLPHLPVVHFPLLLVYYFRRFLLFTPDVVFHAFDSFLAGAVGTAEKVFFGFNAVPDDLAAAMSADGREFMNRALEAVENMFFARRDYLKR